jgi:adenine phosphoribosyltransferase
MGIKVILVSAIVVLLVAVIVRVLTSRNPEKTQEFKTTTTITGVVGELVTLPCLGNDTSSGLLFNWNFYFSKSDRPITMCANGKVDGEFVDICYLPRSSLLNFSLVIRSVSQNQSGMYVCGENNGFGPFHQIHLIVRSAAPTTVSLLANQASENCDEKSSESTWTTGKNTFIASTVNCIFTAGLYCLIGFLFHKLVAVLNVVSRTQNSQPSPIFGSQEMTALLNRQSYVRESCACQKAIAVDDTEPSVDKCWHQMFNEFVLNSVGGQAINAVMRDFCELMKHPDLLHSYITLFAMQVHSKYPDAEAIVGLDTNGYFFALLTAQELRLPFIPVRKLRKLPGEEFTVKYTSRNDETGDMAVQTSALSPGKNVVIIDEKFVTGGTMVAAVKLMNMLCVNLLGCIVVVEDTSHNGREVMRQHHPNVQIMSLFVTRQ